MRAVFKEEYPESITEELPFFLNGVVANIKNDPKCETTAIRCLYNLVFQEIDEGSYNSNLDEIPQKIKDFCMELNDLEEDDIDLLCSFYRDVCNNVKDKQIEETVQDWFLSLEEKE